MALPTTGLTANWDASVMSGNVYNGITGGVPTGSVSAGGAVGAWKSTVNGDHVWIPNLNAAVFQPPAITWENDTVLYLPSVKIHDGSMEPILASTSGQLAQSVFQTNAGKTTIIAFRVVSTSLLANAAQSYNNTELVGNRKNEYSGLYMRNNAGTKTLYAYNWDGGEDQTSVTFSFDTPYVVVLRHLSGTLHLTLIREDTTETSVSVASGNTSSMASGMRLAGSNAAGTEQAELRVGQISFYDVGLSGTDLTDAKAYYFAKWLAAASSGQTFNALLVSP